MINELRLLIKNSRLINNLGRLPPGREVLALPVWDLSEELSGAYGGSMVDRQRAAEQRAEVREFLRTRRDRITPQQAGLPTYGGTRRVKGLRREEVALLAGVSIDYYIRMERGNLGGVSPSVLDALARALELDDAEREHLYALARDTRTSGGVDHSREPLLPVVQQMLDAVSDAPAWVRNQCHDIVAMNPLGRALYAPVLADPRRPANTIRFMYLNPAARDFFIDWERVAKDAAATLRLEAGREPGNRALIELVGELSTRSELFREHWASHDVRFHRSGVKRVRHPVVGELELDYESMDLASQPGLRMNIYTAAAGSPSADGLRLLASWAATETSEHTATERSAIRHGGS